MVSLRLATTEDSIDQSDLHMNIDIVAASVDISRSF